MDKEWGGGGSLAGVRLPEREADNSFACSEEVKYAWNCTSNSLGVHGVLCVCVFVFVRTTFLFYGQDVLRMFGIKKKKKELISRLQRT
jgi:hypothetical protein